MITYNMKPNFNIDTVVLKTDSNHLHLTVRTTYQKSFKTFKIFPLVDHYHMGDLRQYYLKIIPQIWDNIV